MTPFEMFKDQLFFFICPGASLKQTKNNNFSQKIEKITEERSVSLTNPNYHSNCRFGEGGLFQIHYENKFTKTFSPTDILQINSLNLAALD